MRARRPSPFIHAAVLVIVALWTLPTLGLFVTSLRAREAIAVSGWWTSLASDVRRGMVRTSGEPVRQGDRWLLDGVILPVNAAGGRVVALGISSKAPEACSPGRQIGLPAGGWLVVASDGRYRLTLESSPAEGPGLRIFYTARMPPAFTLQNYRQVLGAAGFWRALLNSALVAIPSTLLPTLIAAHAAYALSWMRFPGRGLFLAAVVGLMAVPLQVALIPLLIFFNAAGQAIGADPKGYVAIWLAHTGFGLPLAIHVLRSSMAMLPGAVIESARLDGLSEAGILYRIALPLMLPALAAFATFQFLWIWNDLLVALVFLGPQDNRLVLTGWLLNLMGSRGGEWQILASGAFVSVAVPLMVFLGLRRLMVRGMLPGMVG